MRNQFLQPKHTNHLQAGDDSVVRRATGLCVLQSFSRELNFVERNGRHEIDDESTKEIVFENSAAFDHFGAGVGALVGCSERDEYVQREKNIDYAVHLLKEICFHRRWFERDFEWQRERIVDR